MKVLVTGGAGYIGSHTTLTLLKLGYEVVVLDNLSNSSSESLVRVSNLAGCAPEFVLGDILDRKCLDSIFAKHSIDAVLHFAGLKSVVQSVKVPLEYYENNFAGALNLFQAMSAAAVFTLVFSSSATVYGDLKSVPVNECEPAGKPTNPYGQSKLMVEQVLTDMASSDDRWRIALLRYFNPVGAHSSGMIGEDPNGIPNNLLPFITQVAVGKLPELSVFGNDYPTPDGTAIRDYIHVVDLAEGHLQALKALQNRAGSHVWNLGTGKGHSVLEMIRAFEEVSGRKVKYRFESRRVGDIAKCFADSTKAEHELNWKAERGLPEIMRDAWRWQSMNPTGYKR